MGFKKPLSLRQREIAVILSGTLVVLGTLAFLVFQLLDSRTLILESAKNRNDNIAKIIAARFAAGLKEVDYILRDIADEIKPIDLNQNPPAVRVAYLENYLSRKLSTHNWIFALHVVNAAGLPIACTASGVTLPKSDESTTEWFTQLQQNDAIDFVGSNALPGQGDSPLRVVIARKIHFDANRFSGIITADISLPALQQEFQGFDFVLHGSISVSDSQGVLLFTNPPPKTIGLKLKDDNIAKAFKPGVSSVIVIAPSPLDHISKIIAVQKVKNLPYFATMASPLQDDLETWQHKLLVSCAAFVVILGFVGLFLAAYMRIIRQAQTLELYATTDSLTGLDNRRYFFERAAAEFTQARRYKRSLGVLVCDLDHFKQVNDSCGHAAGDEVLRLFSTVCKNSVREGDLIGRIGGEEIAIVLHETDLELAVLVAERIRQDFAVQVQDLTDCAASNATTVSIGVVAVAETYTDFDAILAAADKALYRAKTGGRNRVEQGE